jgi:hypothetical protein
LTASALSSISKLSKKSNFLELFQTYRNTIGKNFASNIIHREKQNETASNDTELKG